MSEDERGPRLEDERGRQLVTVNGGMAYAWSGAARLKVGEKVWLPGNWTTGHEPFIGIVTRLGSTYRGSHVPITGHAG